MICFSMDLIKFSLNGPSLWKEIIIVLLAEPISVYHLWGLFNESILVRILWNAVISCTYLKHKYNVLHFKLKIKWKHFMNIMVIILIILFLSSKNISKILYQP